MAIPGLGELTRLCSTGQLTSYQSVSLNSSGDNTERCLAVAPRQGFEPRSSSLDSFTPAASNGKWIFSGPVDLISAPQQD